MMEATAKSVTLLTSRGRREKIFQEVLNTGRPTAFKGTVNGPYGQKRGHVKNDCVPHRCCWRSQMKRICHIN